MESVKRSKRAIVKKTILDPSHLPQAHSGTKKVTPKKPKVNIEAAKCHQCKTPGFDGNDVLFCDDCNKPICQRCAEVTEISDGDWFCPSCSKKRADSASKAGFGHPLWSSYVRKVNGYLLRIQREKYTLQTFEAEAARSARHASMIPKSEVIKAKSNIHSAKHNIRNLMKELSLLNSSHKKWICLMPLDDQEKFKQEEGDQVKISEQDNDINVEDVGCSICKSLESTEDNDILLCDRDGCFRAYHMSCLDPPVTRAGNVKERDIDESGEDEGDDEDWFCPQCGCFEDCIELISEIMGQSIKSEKGVITWQDVFKEAESSTMVEPKSTTQVEVGGDSDSDSEDSDFEGKEENENNKGDESDNDDSSSSSGSDSGSGSESSVEWEVSINEIAALSDAELSDSEENNIRSMRSKKRRPKSASDEKEDTESPKEGEEGGERRQGNNDDGALDESNIVIGKRRRKVVDYVALNGELFGDIEDEELDDVETWDQDSSPRA